MPQSPPTPCKQCTCSSSPYRREFQVARDENRDARARAGSLDSLPLQAVGPERVKAIAADGALQQSKWGFDVGHSLALLASGEVIHWGFNAEGEAGSAPEYFGAVLAGPPVKSSGGGEEVTASARSSDLCRRTSQSSHRSPVLAPGGHARRAISATTQAVCYLLRRRTNDPADTTMVLRIPTWPSF